MYIEKLNLINFRNYSQLHLDFNPKMNIIVGPNAQGKTNIIESIYFLSIGKSHRSNTDKELIRWESESAYIKGEFIRDTEKKTIEIGWSQKNKKIKINQVLIEKRGELLGNLYTVLFSPEDLKLIKSGPSERRNFIDREVSNLKPQYYYALLEYNKILQQRNHLLKKIRKQNSLKETIPLWDEQLIEIGSKIIQIRLYFLKKINNLSKELHKKLTDNFEDLELFYQSTVLSSQGDIKNIKEVFKQKLQKNLNIDIQRGTTTIGPHRDDIKVNVNDIDIRSFGSQGQQRTAALSLKLSVFELIKLEIGQTPILLLDDVMSELDQTRQKKLINTIKDVQTFITCTDLNFLRDLNSKEKSIYTIKKGQIHEKQ